ncbi:MAG: bacillithiol system redox-active protein YtxJ [Chitinophagaceae bacterium]
MNWIKLDAIEQLNNISELSATKPQVIFKHSRTCSISGMALARLERSAVPDGADFYLLDLLTYRPVSNAVAEKFQVHHESPQVLVIKNGECVYDESHYAITMDEIAEQL